MPRGLACKVLLWAGAMEQEWEEWRMAMAAKRAAGQQKAWLREPRQAGGGNICRPFANFLAGGDQLIRVGAVEFLCFE